MAADTPESYVATVVKARRKGKILIDYLHNQCSATAVAPYSSRVRPGAVVSGPLLWDGLSPDIRPGHFTILKMLDLLSATDPWQDFHATAVPWMTKA